MDGVELEILWSNLIGIVTERSKALQRIAFSPIVREAGESDLLEIMNAVVRDFPDLKLSSLPQWSGTSARVLELARRVKHAFDPHGILNPGKMFD